MPGAEGALLGGGRGSSSHLLPAAGAGRALLLRRRRGAGAGRVEVAGHARGSRLGALRRRDVQLRRPSSPSPPFLLAATILLLLLILLMLLLDVSVSMSRRRLGSCR